MATENLQIPDVSASQNQKEVTINAAHNLLDRAINQRVNKVITVSTSFTATETRENTLIELTGTPGAAFNIDMPDAFERRIVAYNNTDDVATIRNSAAGGTGQPVIQVGAAVELYYDGTNFINLSAITSFNNPGKLNLSLGELRRIATNDIDTTTNHGGILTSDSTPSYARLNGATDKALRVNWIQGNVDEVQFPPVFMPPDLDETQDLTIHLLARMDAATDTPTIDVQVFDAIGDTEMGGATAALSSTLAELTVTVVAANISGNPLGFLNISLIPGTHATDDVQVFAAWVEYARKTA